jgi:hypothetical protein
MEPEGLLPYSQEPSTSPYPEADRSSPYNPIIIKNNTCVVWNRLIRAVYLQIAIKLVELLH